MFQRLSIFCLCLFVFGASADVHAAVLTVASGDVAGLIAAINQANLTAQEDTIHLAAGVYTLQAVNNRLGGLNGLPAISSKITIRGASAATTSIERDPMLDITVSFRIFFVDEGGDLTLDGVTIRNGIAASDNETPTGGGIRSVGVLNVLNSVITDNDSNGNSAGGISSAGVLNVTDSFITRNHGGDGAGGVVTTGTAHIVGSTISDNGTRFAGGIHNFGGMLVISHSTVADNTRVTSCGGITNEGGTTHVINTTIANNAAQRHAGGICNIGGTMTLTNTTVAGNITGIDVPIRAGITNFVWNGPVGIVELQNTIVASNLVRDYSADEPVIIGHSDCAGPITSLGNNLIGTLDGCALMPQSTDRFGDPGLGAYKDSGAPGGGHFPLLATSPAIDTGNDNVCSSNPLLATDQLGQPRSGICDMGAVEFARPVNSLLTFTPMSWTYKTTSDTSGCPAGCVGTFSFTARLTDKSSSPELTQLVVKVMTLTAGNYLQNADGGPARQGAILTVLQTGDYADGLLSPRQYVDVPFVICLQQYKPFTFLVDVLGVTDTD
jgi:hypothetical protein